MYDENAPRLIAMGFHPIPTARKVPVRFAKELGKLIPFTGWNAFPTPIKTPQPGANIGVRCGDRGLVAIDYDDEGAALAISDVLERSPVNKAGRRAWTAFYRADFEVPSEDFYDGAGRKVLQILSHGRQTVVPPSIHPETGEPYRWTNGRSLYDTPMEQLPLLPREEQHPLFRSLRWT